MSCRQLSKAAEAISLSLAPNYRLCRSSSSCVCQHLKSLPANTVVPRGLQLKVGVTLTLTGCRQRQKHSMPLRTCVTLVLSPPQWGGLTCKGKEYYSETRVSKRNNTVSLKWGSIKLSIWYRKVNLMKNFSE